MISKTIVFLVLVLQSVLVTAANLENLCNPLSATTCSAETALATDIHVDFKEQSDYFKERSTKSGIHYGDDGLTLTLSKRLDNPSLMSDFYIMFGRVEVSLKAGNGKGIVSSFYLQSNDLDEIDIELIGGDTTQWQSNYFVKGNTETYDRGEFHNTDNPPQDDYHNYTIDWTNERIIWYFDGSPVRTLSNDSSQGFPQSPMYLMTGIWAGGDPSNQPGTIEWAGGETDYSQAPFSMHINDLLISDYSSGKSYSYTDQSGKWSSIKAEDGKVLGRLAEAEEAEVDSSSPSSSSEESSSSSSSSSSSTESSSSEQSSSTDTSSSESSSESSTSPDSSSNSDSASDSEAESTTLTTSMASSLTSEPSEDSSSESESTSSQPGVNSDSGANRMTPMVLGPILAYLIL